MQNMVLNFTVPEELQIAVAAGQYLQVRVTKAGPNSLVGEAVDGDRVGKVAQVLPALGTENPLRIL